MNWANEQSHETLVLVRAYEDEELTELDRARKKAERAQANRRAR